MLKSHLNAVESVLLAQSQSASNAGHPNLRGGPREWFIRDFLSTHLPGTLEVGQGEVIDSSSSPRPPRGNYRPQVDIVLYRKDLPKIFVAQDHCAFLAEGVMATIEVKSQLDTEKLKQASKASLCHKSLTRSIPAIGMGSGWRPEHIISYVVAFDGPPEVRTIATWLSELCEDFKSSPEQLPELIVILGKGVVWRLNSFPALKLDPPPEGYNWAYVQQSEKNLFTLFVHMLGWLGWATPPPNVSGYCAALSFKEIGTL